MKILFTLLLLIMLITVGCGFEAISSTSEVTPVAGEELYCAAEDCAKAEEIALLYGIRLVSCEWGIATFHTEEDPATVIERGKTNGWTELNLNVEKQLLG